MKNIQLILLLMVTLKSFGQAPLAINYQGVARDSQGHPLLNQIIGIKLSVLDSNATGLAVYVETHNTTTNSSGLFNLGIGLGSVVTGTFSSIPWGQGDKWLQIEMDASGGNNFQLIGTTQFLSVPYALHSNTANSLVSQNSNQGTFSMISSPNPGVISFWEAMSFCYNLTEGGYSDWRLPTYEEVEKYVEINGLPTSTFIAFTQTLNPSSTNHILVVLNDYTNSSGIGLINVTTSHDTSSPVPHIQCVR